MARCLSLTENYLPFFFFLQFSSPSRPFAYVRTWAARPPRIDTEDRHAINKERDAVSILMRRFPSVPGPTEEVHDGCKLRVVYAPRPENAENR